MMILNYDYDYGYGYELNFNYEEIHFDNNSFFD